MSNIIPDTIKHVAKLAKLSLTSAEEKTFTFQLSQILSYIDLLDDVDTSNIEPTYNVTGLKNITASDTDKPSLQQGVALHNAPNKKKGFFLTKGVTDNE